MCKSDGLLKRSILEVLKVLNTRVSICPELSPSANLYFSEDEFLDGSVCALPTDIRFSVNWTM